MNSPSGLAAIGMRGQDGGGDAVAGGVGERGRSNTQWSESTGGVQRKRSVYNGFGGQGGATEGGASEA